MTKNLKPWIQLNMIKGVGPLRFYTLLRHFGSPEKILAASPKELSEVRGIGQTIADQIVEEKVKVNVEAELEKIEREKVTVLTLRDEDYPKNLHSIFDPPPVLYVKGKLELEDRFAIAIVGSRSASSYGRLTAKQLASQLVQRGITVVSGLARGVDTSAHKGALEAGGRTIGVLGCGLDIIYPPENKGLYEEITNRGAVVSEFPFGTLPEKFNFPQRNRLISGFCFGVVIVEAPIKSGALITSDFALEQGREVFAVPGPVNSRLSAGTNNLIKQGAKLVESADDILEEFELVMEALRSAPPQTQPQKPSLSQEETRVYQLLTDEPQHIDYITYSAKMTASRIAGTLLQLEIKGFATQRRGKMFCRAAAAVG